MSSSDGASSDGSDKGVSGGLGWFLRKVLLLNPNLPPFGQASDVMAAGGDFGEDEEHDAQLRELELLAEGETFTSNISIGGRLATFQVRCISNPYRAIAIFGTDGKELRHLLAQKIKSMKLNGAQVDLVLSSVGGDERVVLLTLRFMQLTDAKKFAKDIEKFLKVPRSGVESAPQDGGQPIAAEAMDAAAAAGFPIRALGHCAVNNDLTCLDVMEGSRGVPIKGVIWRVSKDPGRMLEVETSTVLPVEFPARLIDAYFDSSDMSRLLEQNVLEEHVGHCFLLEAARTFDGREQVSRCTSSCIGPAISMSATCAQICSLPAVVVDGSMPGVDVQGHLGMDVEGAELVRLRLHISRSGISFQHNKIMSSEMGFNELYVSRRASHERKDLLMIHLPDPTEETIRGKEKGEVWFAFEPTKLVTLLVPKKPNDVISPNVLRDILFHVICWHKMLRGVPDWGDFSVGTTTPSLKFQESLTQMWNNTTHWEYRYCQPAAFEIQDIDENLPEEPTKPESAVSSALSSDS
ncbi:MAG: uncharacterized protein KVP18_004155 [Porospora cf. gigantea A]|uniref:uncharacterized protein n=1 Tax=Porospora cf. gigantea A TaxID=2853593 RepID=UPI00355AC6A2|nr:MAG: hypothetical protein KVP18_004155 [Porospora cf. gigantea A]